MVGHGKANVRWKFEKLPFKIMHAEEVVVLEGVSVRKKRQREA